MDRTTSKNSALEYIKTEIEPAVERLQTEYDAKYTLANETQDEEMSLAIRKTFKEKMYDTFVRPIANLFKRKAKIR